MLTNDFIVRLANDTELEDIQRIRRIVFTEEQNIPAELDNDGLDEQSIHAIILEKENNRMAATGRLYIQPTTNQAVLARIAVLKEFRGKGLGKEIVFFLETEAKKRGVSHAELHPHKHLYKFYTEIGYRMAHTEETKVAGHTLLTMVKEL